MIIAWSNVLHILLVESSYSLLHDVLAMSYIAAVNDQTAIRFAIVPRVPFDIPVNQTRHRDLQIVRFGWWHPISQRRSISFIV